MSTEWLCSVTVESPTGASYRDKGENLWPPVIPTGDVAMTIAKHFKQKCSGERTSARRSSSLFGDALRRFLRASFERRLSHALSITKTGTPRSSVRHAPACAHLHRE